MNLPLTLSMLLLNKHSKHVYNLEDFGIDEEPLDGGRFSFLHDRIKGFNIEVFEEDGADAEPLEPAKLRRVRPKDLIMTARVMLGWVDPAELEAMAEEAEAEEAEETEV